MTTRKENDFAISDEGKEKIADRLRTLIGKRSVRAAALDWGLSFSTLNNYLTRGTEPSLNMAIKIAHVERVSIEWLATGVEPERRNEKVAPLENQSAAKIAWLMVLESLDDSEVHALLRAIHKKGVDGIVELATANSLDVELLQLPTEEKERLMALHEAKKGASESCVENTSGGQSQKRAG